MWRMRKLCSLAGVALAGAGLVIAGSASGWAQGMPMGTMKTAPDRTASKNDQDRTNAPAYGPDQAMVPGTPERVTPTYRDTPQDRIMRELTDDGAHDRTDTQR